MFVHPDFEDFFSCHLTARHVLRLIALGYLAPSDVHDNEAIRDAVQAFLDWNLWRSIEQVGQRIA